MDVWPGLDALGSKGLNDYSSIANLFPKLSHNNDIQYSEKENAEVMLLLLVWNTLTVSQTVSITIPLRRDPLRVDVAGLQGMLQQCAWWLSPQGQAGDAITPHRYRDSAHLAWPHLRRFTEPSLWTRWICHDIMSGWHPFNPRLLPCLLLK